MKTTVTIVASVLVCTLVFAPGQSLFTQLLVITLIKGALLNTLKLTVINFYNL